MFFFKGASFADMVFLRFIHVAHRNRFSFFKLLNTNISQCFYPFSCGWTPVCHFQLGAIMSKAALNTPSWAYP